MSENDPQQGIYERLNRVFQEVFDDDEIKITEGTTADDIEDWDSLMHITLVVAIEKEFSIRLNAAEVGKLENVGAMLKLIEAKVSK
jgi:acyl carrier protein